MPKRKPLNKKKFLLIGCLFFLIVSGSFLARGWIRASLLPAYVKVFYKSEVDAAFKNDFTPVNQQLKSYGFTFSQVQQDECWSGDNAMFQGFSETVPCIKQWQSNAITPSSSYITNWQSTSAQLEHYLLTNGWHKEYFAGQPINTILSVPNYKGTVQVNYAKLHGKLVCNLSISYNPSDSEVEGQNNQVYVSESCERDVSFFGGSFG
jgi:hypothetical protein